MPAKLNHTIVAARDRNASALFMSEVLGLDPPVILGPFALVKVGDELTLDFVERPEDIRPQHYAFLVSETEFDQIFSRLEARRLTYWADPHRSRKEQINHWDDGRGVYFEDPNGHLLEILTRPYGSAGITAQNPHPLIAEKLEREPTSERSSAKPRSHSSNSDARSEHPDMDFDTAMKNPGTVFGTPEALDKSTELTAQQKRALLLQWKDQLQQLQAADEEGMQKSGPAAGSTAELLGRVTSVLARIDIDLK